MAKLTLLDLAKMNGSDAVVGLIEESLAAAPELATIPGRTIPGTTFKTLLRNSLPSVGFRKVNQGRPASKSTFENKLVEAFLFAGRLEVDKAALGGSDRSPEELKAIEGAGVVEATLRAIGTQVFYGSDVLGFPGLQAMVDAAFVLDAGGSTASTGSSVYGVKMGERAVSFVFGNAKAMDLSPWRDETLRDAQDKPFPGEVADLTAWVGLQCVSKNAVCRLRDATEDANDGVTDAKLAQLLSKCIGWAPDAWFMSRRSAFQLQTSRTVTIQTSGKDKADGTLMGFAPQPTESNGIPIVITDQIVNTETLS